MQKVYVVLCCIRVILVIEKRARKPFSLGDVPCGFRPKKTMMMRPLFATKSRFIFKEASKGATRKGHIAELPIIRS